MEPTVHEVEIKSLDPSGDGLARIGGRHVSVPFTIPGERVRVEIGARGFASVVTVVRPSPHRVPPLCPHFGPCGGCAWQHIDYPEQLRLKAALVDRLVHEAIPEAPRAHPTMASTPLDRPWGYRQKAHFVFGTAASPDSRGERRSAGAARSALVMGHYARGSRRVIPVHECPVHDPRGNQVAFALRDAFVRAGVGGTLKSVAIRVGAATRETMTTLVVDGDTDRRLRAATRRAVEGPVAVTSLHVNIHPGRDPFIFGPETRRIAGPARIREEVAGVSYLISPTAFFQTNVRAAEVLVRLVLAEVPDRARVLDLYAGTGLFALPLAHAGCRVVAVEENRMAVADGEASARLNRIPPDRCRFIARPVEEALQGRSGGLKAGSGGLSGGLKASGYQGEWDVVILDPPREGCAATVMAAVFGRLRPRRAIYISCHPEALARDLASIVRHGYTVGSLQPVDMFPHTAHIETVAVVTR